jgi:hypothetical protein
MWKRVSQFLASLLGRPERSPDDPAPATTPNDRTQAKARAQFWAELREGQDEADKRSGP